MHLISRLQLTNYCHRPLLLSVTKLRDRYWMVSPNPSAARHEYDIMIILSTSGKRQILLRLWQLQVVRFARNAF